MSRKDPGLCQKKCSGRKCMLPATVSVVFFSRCTFCSGSKAAVRRNELQFFGRGNAAEHFVAMGKAPEAIDDLLVLAGVAEILRIVQLSKQLDRARLHFSILAVLERHVEKPAL